MGTSRLTPLVLLVGVVAVSTAAIWIRFLEALPTAAIAAWRLVLGTLILAPPYLIQHKTRPRAFPPLHGTLIPGMFLTLHFLLWIESLKHTTVASSVVLVTTTPIYTGLWGWWRKKDAPSLSTWLGIALALGGTVGVVGGDGLWTGLRALKGDLLAVGGALCAAGYLISGRSLRARWDTLSYVVPVYAWAAVLLTLWAWIRRVPLFPLPQDAWIWLLLLALIPQAVGHTAFNWALRQRTPTVVSLTILGEPVGATLLAWALLHEVPSLSTLLGGVLILAGIALGTRGGAS